MMMKALPMSVFVACLAYGSPSAAFTVASPSGTHFHLQSVRTQSERQQQQQRPFFTTRVWSKSSSSSDDDDYKYLQRRVQDMRIAIWEEEMSRPPNAALSPTEFICAILDALKHPDDPMPNSGLRTLLRASTKHWRNQVFSSIGAKEDTTEDIAASALSSALERPKNQFGILVGTEDSEEYYLDINSSNELDYHDGTCWVDCRLRQKDTDKLLAVVGWQLQKRNGAWVVDGMEWQDFRDEYRPGIGREEWMRVCG